MFLEFNILKKKHFLLQALLKVDIRRTLKGRPLKMLPSVSWVFSIHPGNAARLAPPLPGRCCFGRMPSGRCGSAIKNVGKDQCFICKRTQNMPKPMEKPRFKPRSIPQNLGF